jgi:tRNA (guanine37-N1)-methyltransferase
MSTSSSQKGKPNLNKSNSPDRAHTMHISIITLFPDMFEGAFSQSIISRAIKSKLIDVSYIQLRDFASDSYGSVDDHPYGGGHGMLLRVDVVDKAIEYAKKSKKQTPHVILLDAQGTPYSQEKALSLSKKTTSHVILVCGHYEGFDERIRTLVDETISIGDYILTGGEIPAMVLIDSLTRLIPGVLKREQATKDESYTSSKTLLEHPQYTRPEIYKSMRVPSVLLSGNHKDIAKWKIEQSHIKTKKLRPDLL